MHDKRLIWGLALLGFLFVANAVYYLVSGWGLITVNVKDAPLGQVIKSIERQGWVKIYSNIDPASTVTMFVDHVPLSEALETLSVNITQPPPPGGNDGGPPGDGGNGGGGFRRGPRGGGGFGGGQVEWKLAFFVGPSKSQVLDEIRQFQEGGSSDDTSIFSYPTMLQTVSGDSEMAVPDPRKQNWPGLPATPPPAPATPAGDNNATASADNGSSGGAAADPGPPTVHDYLRDFARHADIFILTPSAWTPPAAAAPAPDRSIAHAVKSLVGRAHGAVVQAFVLRTRGGFGGRGRPGGREGGFAEGWDSMIDRTRNLIGALPAANRADAQQQLDEMAKFHREIQDLPPDAQREKMRDFFMQKMIDGNNNWRRSPEKRAQRYQRMVAAKAAAKAS